MNTGSINTLETPDAPQAISSVVWATEATYDHEAYSQIRNRSSSNAEDVDFLDDVFDAGMSMPSVPVGLHGQAALAADGSDNVVTPMAPRLRPCSPPSTTVLLPPLEPEGASGITPSSKATEAASNPTSCQSRRHHGDTTTSSSGSSGDPTSSSLEGTSASHHSRASGCEDSSALSKTPSVPAAVDAEQSGGMRAGTTAVTNNTGSSPWGATFGFRLDSATSAAAYASKVSLPPGRGRLPPQSPWFLVDGLPSFGLAQQSELKKRPAPQELENTSAALLKKLRAEQEASRALERKLLFILSGDQEKEAHG